jgi:phosphate transport system substrate-binding protein
MNTRKIRLASTISIAIIALLLIPIVTGVPRSQSYTQGGPSSSTTDPMQFNVTLHARGASFPAPLILNAWIPNYQSQTPGVTVSYQSVGSGAGQRAFMNKTDDFDASDAPLSVAQRYLTPNVLHIPETIGSVTLSYNLPSITANLNLTGAIIAQIYMGQILNWNDPAIQNLNPHVSLPAHQITTVHRSDSSGTTFIFTSFLSQDSAAWASAIGAGTTVAWPGSPTGSPPPIALSGNGNGGVAAVIASTQYSFGYVELNYALQNGFTFAQVQNPTGNFILPSLTTTSYAVENSSTILPSGSADWSSVSMLNRPGSQTYPIASFTYFIVYKELNVIPDMNLNETFQANALINFLYWAVNKGQQYTSALSYVPLPLFVRQLDNQTIQSITYTTPSKISRTIHLSESAAGGWNGTGTAGPSITIYSGDTINLILSSSDAPATHQWFVDYNNNGVLDANEMATASATFNSLTPTASPAITPAIGINVPAAGTWTYRDNNNPANTGTIQVIPQQIAAPYLVPASLTAGNALRLDSSKVTTVGSLIINMRTLTFSGNITEVAVDSTSGTVTFAKSYLLPNIQLHTVPNTPGVQARFVFNAAVLPYPESSIGSLQLTGTTATLNNILTREVDMAANGFVSIVDVGVVFGDYGFSVGNPSYNPQANLTGTGTVNINDVSIVALNYGAPVFR